MLFIYAFSLVFGGSKANFDDIKCYTGADIDAKEIDAMSRDVQVSSRIFELFFGNKNEKNEPVMLYPGGSVFGLIINEDGVTVTEVRSGRALLVGDRIIAVNGNEVNETGEVEELVKSSGGKRMDIEVIRCGERVNLSVTPRMEDGEYTLGAKLRSRTAGIGTVTFIDPETHAFGGLGHGVSDTASNTPVSLRSGAVTSVTLGSCKRGEIGHAGELTGILKQTRLGSINLNNECGIFGTLDDLPDYCTKAIPAAARDDVKCAKAEIIATVKNGMRQTYEIEIYDIDHSSTGSKSFKIKVTDPTLISLSGGIVRGMSGSPIIQDGKLVGAVTHVMVANPTEGYGIFIENMLNAAQSQAQPKAA